MEEVKSIYGRSHVVIFRPALESLSINCQGGFWEKRIEKEGLFDPEDPYEQPQGSLVVRVRPTRFQQLIQDGAIQS